MISTKELEKKIRENCWEKKKKSAKIKNYTEQHNTEQHNAEQHNTEQN
jgi:hypothetical protein